MVPAYRKEGTSAYPASCGVHECLLGGFTICTGALSCRLRGARALAQRVLQNARAHCPVDCGVHGRISLWIARCTGACPASFAICTGAYLMDLQRSRDARALARRICNMHRRIPHELAESTGACPADLKSTRALTRWTCGVHRHLPSGFTKCTGALPGILHCLKKDAFALLNENAELNENYRVELNEKCVAKVHRHLPGKFTRNTGACPADLQETQALAQRTCVAYCFARGLLCC
ncbi:hypothetical protein CRG98_008733 [Punica granatum]|uniref:Uncharacterized protein n=1 Tax=Punica granatum TaxID=22663 RepID=A0A2I0KQT8_PUNGR|nr:hypothetical protein CRG98_008733 [Punica granatum]